MLGPPPEAPKSSCWVPGRLGLTQAAARSRQSRHFTAKIRGPPRQVSRPSPSGSRLLRGQASEREGRSLLVLCLLLELAGGLFVLFTDLVELLHVLKEVGTSLEGDEQFGFLAVVPLVVTSGARRLNCDGLGSDLLECSVVVSA